jgi:hypothetical protein
LNHCFAEVPYDFPLELDGLPRAKELGDSMSKLSLAGFYKSSSDERKQDMLAEVFRFRPGRTEPLDLPRVALQDNNEAWPNVETALPMKSKTISKPIALSQKKATDASVLKKRTAGQQTNSIRPNGNSTSLHNRSSGPLKNSKSAPATKPKALGERDANAVNTRKVLNPALRDFENDQMGKIIKAKLKASEGEEFQGFLI